MSFTVNANPQHAATQTANTTNHTDARERAISKLMGQGSPAQEQPVPNASQISPEEMSAVKAPDSGQKYNSEESSETLEGAVEAQKAAEAPKETEEPLSSQFAVLARKEKALRAKVQQQEQAYSKREQELAAREAALKAKEQEYTTGYVPKSALAEDPWSILAEQGITYDQLTQQVLNQPQENPQQKAAFKRLQDEIRGLKEAQEAAVKAQQDQQQAAYQQAVEQLKRETKSLVSSDPEFEVIKETNSIDDVVELIERTYKEDKYLMTVEEACKAVEEHLMEEASKLAKLKKIQSKLQAVAPSIPAKSEQASPQAGKQSQPTKTLTNAVGAVGKLSAKERAILAFKGELKK